MAKAIGRRPPHRSSPSGLPLQAASLSAVGPVRSVYCCMRCWLTFSKPAVTSRPTILGWEASKQPRAIDACDDHVEKLVRSDSPNDTLAHGTQTPDRCKDGSHTCDCGAAKVVL